MKTGTIGKIDDALPFRLGRILHQAGDGHDPLADVLASGEDQGAHPVGEVERDAQGMRYGQPDEQYQKGTARDAVNGCESLHLVPHWL